MNIKSKKFLFIGAWIIVVCLILSIFFYLKHQRDITKDAIIDQIKQEQNKNIDSQAIINQVNNFNTWSTFIDTWSLERFLKEQNTPYYNECLYEWQSQIKNCIMRKEKEKFEKMWDYSLEECKKLVFYKDRCLNVLYYKRAKEEQNIKFCDYIKDSTKDICLKNVKAVIDRENQIKQITQKAEQNIKNNLDTISKTNDINSCKWMESSFKVTCVNKFVNKEKDLRLCSKYLDKNQAVECMNINWSEIVTYNLLKAKETKDKTYCEKIYIDDWKSKCLSSIK